MYINRLFFRKDTGILICRDYKNGEFAGSIPTIDDDFKALSSLQQYVKDAVEVIEVAKNDIDTQNKLNTCTSVSLDITTSKLIFSFTTLEISLDQAKQTKVQELENDCTKVKDNGFKSSCLGTEKVFDSSPENRNLIVGLAMKASLVASGTTLPDSTIDWKAKDEPVCYSWQPQQMIMLGVDMSTFLTNTIKHKEQLQQYANSLTTVEEVEKVTWDTVIPAQK